MKSFRDKVIVITGAASGIGRALAIQMGADHAILHLIDKDTFGLEETKKLLPSEIQKRATLYEADVSSRERIYEIAESVINDSGRIDVIINNAGVALDGDLADVSYEEMEWLMGINFWGVVYGTKAYLPHFINQNSGYIINISSLFGLTGVAGNGTYCASKFAVRGFTESLRAELLETNVKVMSVHPGGIKTNIVRNSRTRKDKNDPEVQKQIERTMKAFRTTPEQAANTIIKGIRRGKSRVLIGSDAKQADIIIRLMPERAVPIFYKLTARLREISTPKT